MRIPKTASALVFVAGCLLAAGCANATKTAPAVPLPTEASQTVLGVTVAVETTTTKEPEESSYSLGGILASPKPGFRRVSIVGTATNSTDTTVAVPAVPVTVRDSTGAELLPMRGLQAILDSSGQLQEGRGTRRRRRPAQGMASSGHAIYLGSWEQPVSSRGPVTVTWTLGGERTFTFELRTP